jgi:cytochrome P450 family 4
MIIYLLLLCIFIVLLYYGIHFAKFVYLINHIPSYPALPVLGHTIDLWRRSPENFWKLQRSLAKDYYPIYKLWIGPIAFVSIHDPDDLEKILSSPKEHTSKGFVYHFLEPWLGTGLLTSEGAKWHNRRKILTPTFHFNILKQFVEILIEEGNHMTKCLKNMKESTIDDLMMFISHHTLNAICETAMGTSLKETGKFQVKYREAVYEVGKIVIHRMFRPWVTSDKIFSLTSTGKKHDTYVKILHDFTEKIIAERKQYHENTGGKYLKHIENDNIGTDEVIGIKKKRLAMLDLLILAARNNEINDSGIKEEVDTFMFEGHDTVAMGLTFGILVLAEHKKVQECIRNEVSAVIQANEGKLTMSALNNMPYLERCLKEALRLYPSVPVILRIVSEDVKLHKYLVPAGTSLFINIYDIHRDPNIWPNPDEFDPDRFLPENIQKRHPYSYLPFSAGPRNCIGKRFAMLELKAVMASLIYNFYLEPIDYLKDLTFTTDIISRVTRPIRTRFIPIDRASPDLSKVM